MKPGAAALLRQQALIDGDWLDAASGATFEVRNPANGDLVGTVPQKQSCLTLRFPHESRRHRAIDCGADLTSQHMPIWPRDCKFPH